MRAKQEILEQSHRTILKLPKQGALMVEHEHLFLEVWIDIRDELNEMNNILASIKNIQYREA